MMKGKIVYEPPRFMTVGQAAELLLKIVSQHDNPDLKSSDLCVAVARVGRSTQQIACRPLVDLINLDLGKPLHSIVVCGNLYPLEEEFLKAFSDFQSSS